MKKFLLLLILCFGCSNPCHYKYEWKSPEKFQNLEMLLEWMDNNLERTKKYEYVNSANDYWQTPQETLDRKGGDCEDWALFFMYHAENLGLETKLIIIEKVTNSIHAVVLCNNKIYDPIRRSEPFESLKVYPEYKRSIEEYTFNKAMWWTENFHGDILIL